MLRYLRNHDAISEAEQAILAQKRVLVVGCGGLGGYVIECLARIGVGHLRVVDGDVFDETNLNRQLLSSSMNLGRPKTLAAQQRVMAVNPLVEVEAFQTLLTAENAVQLLEGCDVAVDARQCSHSLVVAAGSQNRWHSTCSRCGRWLDWAVVCRAARSGIAQFTLSSFNGYSG